jgi:hypothetical protein
MSIKVGDLISTYYAGYYEVVKVVRRWENKVGKTPYERFAYCTIGEDNFDKDTCGEEMNPLLTFIQKFTKEGKPVVTRKEKMCCSSYCKPAKEYVADEIKKLELVLKQLGDVHKL